MNRRETNFLRGLIVTGQGGMTKLKERRFGLNVGRKFFTHRELRHWHRLPEEAMATLPWRCSGQKVGWGLGALIWWMATLSMSEGLE